MPLYEFLCTRCGAREEVFVRSMSAEVHAPPCPNAPGAAGHAMERVVSSFARHRTQADQVAEAEAKFGKQVNAAMGPEPDVGRLARRYANLSKDLPKREDL